MLFDTHAHYDDEAFNPDRELLLESLPQRGVALVLNPGCDLDSSRKAVSYAAAYPHVYAAVGIHPENCAGFVPADIDVLRELARQPKVAAIGEIGLDYYWAENPPRELQQQVLRAQLAGGVQCALVVQAQVVAEPEQHGAHGCAPALPAVGVALRWRRQRSEQYFTSSHTLAHFLRQVKGRPQHWQGFSGR